MKLIKYDRMPCWYELSFDPDPLSFTVRMHKDFLSSHGDIKNDVPIAESLKKEVGLSAFSGSFGKDFGFDSALKFRGIKGEFHEYSAAIPEIKTTTCAPCDRCKGTGMREDYPEEKCIYCEGDKQQRDYRWNEALAISATCTLLFLYLDDECMTSSKQDQLLTLRTMTTGRMRDGAGIGGVYGIELTRFLSAYKEGERVKEMDEAMRAAYKRMMTLRFYEYECSFRASVDYKNGWLNVSIPGDACGLNPSNGEPRAGEGYEFSCHNTDTVAQQLTLLCGLGALHDLARKYSAK